MLEEALSFEGCQCPAEGLSGEVDIVLNMGGREHTTGAHQVDAFIEHAAPQAPEDIQGHLGHFVAGATLAVPLGEKWAWVTDGAVQVLSEEITDSPIVEDDAILTFVTGLVYRY